MKFFQVFGARGELARRLVRRCAGAVGVATQGEKRTGAWADGSSSAEVILKTAGGGPHSDRRAKSADLAERFGRGHPPRPGRAGWPDGAGRALVGRNGYQRSRH